MARQLAHDLLARADQLMYEAKANRLAHVEPVRVRVVDGVLDDRPGRASRTGTDVLVLLPVRVQAVEVSSLRRERERSSPAVLH